MRSLGRKATVSSMSSWRASRTKVFSPVTTALRSEADMFLRLSLRTRWMLSVAWKVSGTGTAGLSPAAAAVASRAGVLSSRRNIIVSYIYQCTVITRRGAV